jgi:hypothetical protein
MPKIVQHAKLKDREELSPKKKDKQENGIKT